MLFCLARVEVDAWSLQACEQKGVQKFWTMCGNETEKTD